MIIAILVIFFNYLKQKHPFIKAAEDLILVAPVTELEKKKLKNALRKTVFKKGLGASHAINKERIVMYENNTFDDLVHELAHIISPNYDHDETFYCKLDLLNTR